MRSEKLFCCDWERFYAATWREWKGYLKPIEHLDKCSLDALKGIDAQKEKLIKNTRLFIQGLESFNALLWGARGMGKSSLIKALLLAFASNGLRVVEIPSISLRILPDLMDHLRQIDYYFIVFCDDISFEKPNKSYRALKSVLEGSIESFPKNIRIYATSNRCHLIRELQSENQALFNEEIHATNSVDEKLSLSDRFALSVGFYTPSIQEYREQVQVYFQNKIDDALFSKALVFASARGGRSGRVARQFYIAYQYELL